MKKQTIIAGIGLMSLFFSAKVSAQVPVADFSLSLSTVCVGGTVQITDMSTDSPTAWSYSVDGASAFSSAQNPTISFVAAGIYTLGLTATNGNGDSAPFSQTIAVNALPSVSASGNAAVCAGGSLTLSGAGANTYVWTGGLTNGSAFAPSSNASYSVTGTDLNGCENMAVVDVTVNPLPSLNISGNPAVCLGSSLSFTATGADSYSWNAVSGTDVFSASPTTSGVYNLVGEFALTGCSSSSIIAYTVNQLPVIAVNSGTMCAGTSFTMIPTGGTTYSYSSPSDIVSPNTTNSYTVYGTDANGCQNTAVSDVTVIAKPVVSAPNATICEGETFTLVPTGALNYTFSSGSNQVNPTTTTSYSITGVDVNGCLSDITVVQVSVNAMPVLVAPSGAICVGNSFTINPTGAASYTITGNNFTVNPTSNASYNLSGTSAEGCLSAVLVVNVTVNQLPTISVNSGTMCAGTSFTMMPAGGSTYSYSSSSDIVSPAANTSYTVFGTDANGCQNTAVSNVTVVAKPVVTAPNGTICAGETFTLVPTGALNYTYSSASNQVNPTTTTNYSITGVDANGCVSSPAVVQVSVNALPVVAAASGSICMGDSYTITPTGAVSYSITGNNFTVNPTTNTAYNISGTSAEGCVSAVSVVNVTVNLVPTIAVNSGSICSGQVFTLVPSGAASYVYVSGSNTVSPATTSTFAVTGISAEGCASSNTAIANVVVQTSPTLSVVDGTICAGDSYSIQPNGADTYTINGNTWNVNPTANTSYTINGASLSGCNAVAPVVVNVVVNQLPVIAISGNATVCAGENATLTASGALTFAWSTTAISNSIVVAPASNTTYSVAGIDANGCVGLMSETVIVNALPVLTVNSGSICAGESFTIVPTGGVTYTYSTGPVVTPVANTTYSVTGTDINGCVSANAALSTVTVVVVNIAATGAATICEGLPVALSATGANSYSWGTLGTGANHTVTPAASTVYTVIGTVSTCTNFATVAVVVNPNPTVTATSANATICAGESTTLTATGADTYVWDNNTSAATNVVSPVATTVYTVTGTNNTSCANKGYVTVSVDACTGIAKQENKIFASIFPNPSKGDVTLNVSTQVDVKVINAVGQTVISEQAVNGNYTIALSSQPQGVYFVQLFDGANTKTIKIVRN